MIFIILFIVFIITIKYLPFINLDASLALQEWLKNIERKLEDAIDFIEEKNNKKK